MTRYCELGESEKETDRHTERREREKERERENNFFCVDSESDSVNFCWDSPWYISIPFLFSWCFVFTEALCLFVYSLSRLGQACNHIAALLFFFEKHCGKSTDLPTELSRTSQPMTWSQAPRKVVSACAVSDMQFVKPSYRAANENSETSMKVSRLTCDPRRRENCSLDSITSEIARCCFEVSPREWFATILGELSPPIWATRIQQAYT